MSDEGREQLLIDAAKLLSIATVGSGADPVEFDRRATDWLQRYDEICDEGGPTAEQSAVARAWGYDV